MELAHLETFVAVAEAGGISAAAQTRNLSQPAVSLHIKALEEELGVSLLHRGARGTTLTQAGEGFLAHARAALSALEAGRVEAAHERGLHGGTLKLGVTDAAATGILPRWVVAFHRRHPGIEVAVEVASTSDLLGGLVDGRFPLALGTLPVEEPRCESRPLVTETLGLVAPAAKRGRSLDRVLAEEPFMAYPRDSTTRRLVDRALSRAGLAARPIMEIGRPGVMVRLVEAGLGVSVLPHSVSEPGVRAGTLCRMGARRLRVSRTLGLIQVRGRVPEPAERAFLDVLRDMPSE